jgi:hypothetical protein
MRRFTKAKCYLLIIINPIKILLNKVTYICMYSSKIDLKPLGNRDMYKK